MKLDHINLTVSNIEGAWDFLTNYFDLNPLFGTSGADDVAILTDGNGMLVSLMNPSQDNEIDYPGMFHIGFTQDSQEKVDIINERLRKDGFSVKPARIFHGSYTFYVKAPGGFVVEVLTNPLNAVSK